MALGVFFCSKSIKLIIFFSRCATGEAWPDIMLDAQDGRPCDPLSIEINKTSGIQFDKQTSYLFNNTLNKPTYSMVNNS